jgi:L-ribulose-5-phosphate 3-epimerase
VKLGIFQGAFAPQLPMEDCLRIARLEGFDGFELSLETALDLLPEAYNEQTESIRAIQRSVGLLDPRPGGIRYESQPAEWFAIKPFAEKLDLRLISISTMLLFYYPLSSPIQVVRERALDIVRKMIDITAGVGGDLVLVAPGMVQGDTTYKQAWERTQVALEKLLPYAEERRISLALENIWNKFLLSPLEFARFIDAFQSPWIGAYFDVANILAYGNPDEWISYLGNRIKRVHFKDYRLDIGGIQGFTNLLHGDVPWQKVMQALNAIQYDGWIVAEVTPYRTKPEQTLPDTFAALKSILSLPTG